MFKKQSRLTNKTCSSQKDCFPIRKKIYMSSNVSFYSERHIFPLSTRCEVQKMMFLFAESMGFLDFLRQSCKIKRKTFVLFFGALQKIACFILMRLKRLKLGVITTNTVVTRNLQFCWLCILKSLDSTSPPYLLISFYKVYI